MSNIINSKLSRKSILSKTKIYFRKINVAFRREIREKDHFENLLNVKYHKFEIVKTKLKPFSVEIPLTFRTNIGFVY
jgi:hypothetical protein